MKIYFDEIISKQQYFFDESDINVINKNLNNEFFNEEEKKDFNELLTKIDKKSLNNIQTNSPFYEEINPRLTFNKENMSKTDLGKLGVYLINRSDIEVNFRDLNNVWHDKKYKNTWPVTIDTLFFITELYEFLKNKNLDIKNILDLGCGSGFLGQHLSKIFTSSEITFADINPNALKLSKVNNEINNFSSKFNYVETDSFSKIQGKFDLIVMNPPYIPHKPIDHLEKNSHNCYNGLDLLLNSLENFEDYLNKNGYLIFLYSDVGKNEVEQKLNGSSFNIISKNSLEVPFRIEDILKDKSWMKKLIEINGLIHKKISKDNKYEFWHKLNLIIIKK